MNGNEAKVRRKPAGEAMEGGGFYNRHSSMQAGGIALVLPLLREAAQTVPIGEEPVVIADYGASQGRNSMAPMRIAIEEVRARTGPDRPIQIFHTDLPSNDFAALFGTLESDPATYLADTVNVFPAAIGRSYFETILPPASVHLGWNTWTLHWLDGKPIEVPDHLFVGLSQDAATISQVQRQQESDWRRFLQFRATELRPGGRLITAFGGTKPGAPGWRWLGGELFAAVLDLVQEGVLSTEERRRMSLPVCPRSIEAIRDPFEKNGVFADLRLDHSDVIDVPDPFWPAFEATGDAHAFAVSHANTLRAWSGPTIAHSLIDRPDKAAVIDRLYGRLAERLAMAPRQHEPKLGVAVLTRL